MKLSGNVAMLIERYFTERLLRQRNVSSNTIASYRDTFRLLFTYAQSRLRKTPSRIVMLKTVDNEHQSTPMAGQMVADRARISRYPATVNGRPMRANALVSNAPVP